MNVFILVIYVHNDHIEFFIFGQFCRVYVIKSILAEGLKLLVIWTETEMIFGNLEHALTVIDGYNAFKATLQLAL